MRVEIDEYFPHETYREGQREAIEKIVKYEGEGVVLEAPTGSGKSAIAYTAGKVIGSTYIITTTKVLQEQMKKYGVPVLKGKNNYVCAADGVKADVAKCSVGIISASDCEYYDECPYYVARRVAMNSDVCCLNVAYAVVGRLEKRRFVVVDECHRLDDICLNFVGMSIYEKGWGIRRKKDGESVEEYVEYLDRELVPKVDRYIARKYAKLEREYNVIDAREVERMKRFLNRLMFLVDSVRMGYKWVYWTEGDRIKLSPIDVGWFVNSRILRLGEKVLAMSATVCDVKVFARESGIKLDGRRVKFIRMPMRFPVENRRVYFIPCGKMGYESKGESVLFVGNMIEKILKKYSEYNAIVHCNSYEIAKMIYDVVDFGTRNVILQSEGERDDAYREFIEKGGVYLSVKMTEGIDLYEDRARINIIAKVPFPYLKDERIKVKSEVNKDWYMWKAVCDIVQACGRGVRSETDWCRNYILDSDFAYLYFSCKKMFPDWFKKAIVWGKVKGNREVVFKELMRKFNELCDEFGDTTYDELAEYSGMNKRVVWYFIECLRERGVVFVDGDKIIRV